MMNLNYLFSHEYYPPKGFTYRVFDDCNTIMTDAQFQSSGEAIPSTETCFVLETTYPGLVFGLGNAHQVGTNIGGTEKEVAEIKLGFTLDYVTGLPIIPGSTVKGVLRSAFLRYPDAIDPALQPLMRDIFGSFADRQDPHIRGKCVFHDAIPVKKAKDKKLFGLDNITPHICVDDESYDGLVNPNPLTMLKVLPGVQYLFRFGMDRLTGDAETNIQRILTLFKEILLNLGIGAKTNVGFGRLVEPKDSLPAPYKMLAYSGQASNQKNQVGQGNPARSNAQGRGGPQPQYQGVPAPQKSQEGICQHPGCGKQTPKKKDGTHHPRCQEHRDDKPSPILHFKK